MLLTWFYISSIPTHPYHDILGTQFSLGSEAMFLTITLLTTFLWGDKLNEKRLKRVSVMTPILQMRSRAAPQVRRGIKTVYEWRETWGAAQCNLPEISKWNDNNPKQATGSNAPGGLFPSSQ